MFFGISGRSLRFIPLPSIMGYHGVFEKMVLLHFLGGKWYGGRLGGSPPFSVLDVAFGASTQKPSNTEPQDATRREI